MKYYIKTTFILFFLPIFFIFLLSYHNSKLIFNESNVKKSQADIYNISEEIPIAPLKGNITSSFGYRVHPITGNLDFHDALDIGAQYREDIRSILSGEVKETGYSNIYGNYIIISHKNNIESKYCHCDKILKNKNKKVKKGEIICVVGHTGFVTGDHLHLEIKINDINIDPLLMIKFMDEYRG